MEGSGKIFIYEGLLVARLYATDNLNMVTDNLQPLTYHVIEHFLGGRQYDITVPTSTSGAPIQLSDCIIPSTIEPTKYSAIDVLGSALEDFYQQAANLDLVLPALPALPVQTINSLSTDYVQIDVTAALTSGQLVNPSVDDISVAFMPSSSGLPAVSDWNAAVWVNPSGPAPYLAQLLIGPDNGGVPVASGVYKIYVQLVDFPQVLVQLVGLLYVS